MRDPNRLRITREIIDRFYAYYKQNPSWGACHVCLSDGNYDMVDNPQWALDKGDIEGSKLCEILEELTPTQRGKIAKRCSERLTLEYRPK